MDEIRRAIATGALHAEDPLPSVRQLGADLRVNPHTVAQAYRELERDGLVSVRRGTGTFVTGAGSGPEDRRALARDVAEQALIHAHAHGIDPDELIDAIREVRSLHSINTDATTA